MNTRTNKKNIITTTNNKSIIEFLKNIKYDGIIIIDKDKIIKQKPIHNLTVDLIYDAKVGVFLDEDRNIYDLATMY